MKHRVWLSLLFILVAAVAVNSAEAKTDEEIIAEAVAESIAKAYGEQFARGYIEQAVNAALPAPPPGQMPVGTAAVFAYDFVNAGKALGEARDPEQKLMATAQMASTIVGLANPALGAAMKAAHFALQVALGILNSKHNRTMMKIDLAIAESYRSVLLAHGAQVNAEIAYLQNLLLSASTTSGRINELYSKINQDSLCLVNREHNLDECFSLVEEIVFNQILFLSLSERILLYRFQYIPVIQTLQKLNVSTSTLAAAAQQGVLTFKILRTQLNSSRQAYVQSKVNKIFEVAESREHISGAEQLASWCMEQVEQVKNDILFQLLGAVADNVKSVQPIRRSASRIDPLCFEYRSESAIIDRGLSLIDQMQTTLKFNLVNGVHE